MLFSDGDMKVAHFDAKSPLSRRAGITVLDQHRDSDQNCDSYGAVDTTMTPR